MAESVKILIGPPLVRRFRNQRACRGCAHPLNSNFLIILKGLQSEEVQSIRFSRIEGVGPTATEARPFAGSAKARFEAVPTQLLSPQASALANLMTLKGDEPPFHAGRYLNRLHFLGLETFKDYQESEWLRDANTSWERWHLLRHER